MSPLALLLPILLLAPSALARIPFSSHQPRIHYYPTQCDSGVSSCPDSSTSNVTYLNQTLNECCKPAPGGLFLQTQFWTSGSGPSDSWTVHGLWPDFCNGSYPAFCNPQLEYGDNQIRQTLLEYGKAGKELLKEMDYIWTDPGNTPEARESFWAHEFNKHGTCISTFAPKCYGKGQFYSDFKNGLNLYDYYTKTLTLFKRFPTYKWLSEAGIHPDATKNLTLSEVVNVLKAKSGAVPYLGCINGTLDEVWYYFHVNGRVQSLDITPVDSTSNSTKCANGFKWLPKSGNSTSA